MANKLLASFDRSLRRLTKLEPVKAARNIALWQRFRTAKSGNMFWGVYDDFVQAEAAAPQGKPIGYDNDGAASLYRWKFDVVEPSDYAVLYWLERALRPGARVFDFGGHVGIKYYTFRSIGALNQPLTWMVYDVPAVLRAGRELARERGESNVVFTDDVSEASGADVFMALGASQYVETPMYRTIGKLERPPGVVIISKAPMVEGPRYVTLQNMGAAFCPYLVEDVRDLIAGMERIGYQLLHRWKNDEKSCEILSHPERSIYAYTSLHFSRAP